MTTRLRFEQIREVIRKRGEGYYDGMRRLSEEIKDRNKQGQVDVQRGDLRRRHER